MQDKFRTKEQLVNELIVLRQRVAELEKSQSEIKQAEEKYKNIFENCYGRNISDNPGRAFYGCQPSCRTSLRV